MSPLTTPAPEASGGEEGLIFRDGFEFPDLSAWSEFFGGRLPSISFFGPRFGLVINEPRPEIEIRLRSGSRALDLDSLRVAVGSQDITASCQLSVNRFSEHTAVCQPRAPLEAGFHEVTVSVANTLGLGVTESETFELLLDTAAPVIQLQSPQDGALLTSPSVQIRGRVEDDDQVVRLVAGPRRQDVEVGGGEFAFQLAMESGENRIDLEAQDRAGNRGSATLVVRLDAAGPRVTVEAPLAGAITNQATIGVAGSVTDGLGTGVESLRVNGVAVEIVDERFSTEAALPEGSSQLVVEARDVAGNLSRRTVQVTRLTPPEVVITEPADFSYVQGATINVAGKALNAATVSVNGVAAELEAGVFLAENVPLGAGGTLLVARALSASGNAASDKVTVIRDAVAPRLFIEEPREGAVVDAETVAVTGLVNDTVFGTVHEGQVTVTVAGFPAQVANRSFIAPAVPLEPGENLLHVEAVDTSGNARSAQVRVVRQAPIGPRIRKVSGNLQEAEIGEELSESLVVEVRDADGQPVAGRPVVFEVGRSNGSLEGSSAAGVRRLVETSGADGRASVLFALGTRAGVGNHRVRATAPGFLGQAVFLASARPGPPAHLVVDGGDQQRGAAGRFVPNPLTAVVTDGAFNRLDGVAVRFRVVRGDGSLDDGAGGESGLVVLESDGDGRAQVSLRLGAEEGVGNNVVEVELPDHPGVPFVSFAASGLMVGDPAATRVSGLVLDNADQPVPGVTLSVRGTALEAVSDESGVFEIEGAPVGTFFLDVDGTTTSREGTWPHLEFEMTTVAGRDNTVGMPIYLLPLDERGLAVSESEGGTLTLPELPGFSLEVAPGSVTFPGGGRSGVVGVTLVHGDRVPMVPGFGQQPRFIVTIQPAGAIFDPPARLSLPNVDALAPGEVTELYSFDHDLGAFVSIGPATVTEDASAVVSNPGVGILKAGWHCGGNPTTSGTPHDCPPCQICNGSTCVPGCAAPAEARRDVFPATPDFLGGLSSLGCECPEDDPCRFDYRCDGNGGCLSTPVKVDGITGPCIAAVGESKTFTAEANKPSKVQWQSSGSPSEGTGATFSVTFGTEGEHAVGAGCGDTGEVKQVSVLPSCSSLPAPILEEPRVEIPVPGNAFGLVHGAMDQEVEITPCGAAGQKCYRLLRYRETHGFGVGSNRIDVGDPTDPSLVNPQTCALIILDLLPPTGEDIASGPARTTYWSRAATNEHEEYHAREISDIVTQTVFDELQEFVESQDRCSPCDGSLTAEQVLSEAERLFADSYDNVFASGSEERAYQATNGAYTELIRAIREQSTGSWPAICQPTGN